MTDYFASAHVSSTIGDAMEKMLREGLSRLLIVDDRSHLVGCIEEPLLMETFLDSGLRSESVVLHMETDLYSISPDDSAGDVFQSFRVRGVSEFPVTENGKLIGVLTRRQLLRALLGRMRSDGRNLFFQSMHR